MKVVDTIMALPPNKTSAVAVASAVAVGLAYEWWNVFTEPVLYVTVGRKGIDVMVESQAVRQQKWIVKHEIEIKEEKHQPRYESEQHHEMYIDKLQPGHKYTVRARFCLFGGLHSNWSAVEHIQTCFEYTQACVIKQEKFIEESNKLKELTTPMLVCKYNILLVGTYGIGKSCAINTFLKSFDFKATVRTGTGGHHTTDVNKIRMGDTSVHFWDTWGEEDLGKGEQSKKSEAYYDPTFMQQLMQGKIKHGYKKGGINQDDKIAEGVQPLEERVHAVVIVVPMHQWSSHPGIKETVEKMKEYVHQNQLQPFVLMTHADEVDSTLSHNHNGIFESVEVENQVKKFSETTGFDRDSIMPFICLPSPTSSVSDVQRYLSRSVFAKLGEMCCAWYKERE
jgi:GTP-binding protein EngB required for normal cell division